VDNPLLEDDLPEVSFEAARYNAQVKAIRGVIEELRTLDESVRANTDRSELAAKQFRADLHANRQMVAENRALLDQMRELVAAGLASNRETQDAITTLKSELPDGGLADRISLAIIENTYLFFEDNSKHLASLINLELTKMMENGIRRTQATVEAFEKAGTDVLAQMNDTLTTSVLRGARQIHDPAIGLPPLPPPPADTASRISKVNAVLATVFIRWRRFYNSALPQLVILAALAVFVWQAIDGHRLKP
jgi:hypothetical protein